jgi:outer membrane protein
MMKASTKVLGLLAATASVFCATQSRAEEGKWEARLRAVYLSPANKSDSIGALAVPKDAIHINSKALPDIDFEYFMTPNWSSELVLTYPQSQTVTVRQSALGGPTDIGSFKHLPPTLTLKYNFAPDATFRPYVGVGVNLTLLSKIDLAVPTNPPLKLDLKKTSIGPAVQAGFDVKVADHWFVNADIKWAQLRTDVKLNGTKLAKVKVDPVLFGVGVGYRW